MYAKHQDCTAFLEPSMVFSQWHELECCKILDEVVYDMKHLEHRGEAPCPDPQRAIKVLQCGFIPELQRILCGS